MRARRPRRVRTQIEKGLQSCGGKRPCAAWLSRRGVILAYYSCSGRKNVPGMRFVGVVLLWHFRSRRFKAVFLSGSRGVGVLHFLRLAFRVGYAALALTRHFSASEGNLALNASPIMRGSHVFGMLLFCNSHVRYAAATAARHTCLGWQGQGR